MYWIIGIAAAVVTIAIARAAYIGLGRIENLDYPRR